MRYIGIAMAVCMLGWVAMAEDNTLTPDEVQDGWILLFDGKTLDGWETSSLRPSKTPVEDGCINPHKCGGYMMVHEKQWGDFVLQADFKISPGCNSGIFVRTFPLKNIVPGGSIGLNGLEMQILDSTEAGMHDTGALYDLVAPSKNAMKPVGEWNHAEITCNDNLIEVAVNGDKVASMDLNEWTEAGKRPDGTGHKFPFVMKDRPRRGYIGLQDHGSPVWFKNLKLKPLGEADKAQAAGR